MLVDALAICCGGAEIDWWGDAGIDCWAGAGLDCWAGAGTDWWDGAGNNCWGDGVVPSFAMRDLMVSL